MYFASLSVRLDKFSVANGDMGLSNRTLNRHVNSLGALWKWADRQGMLPDHTRSPFSGLARPTGRKSRTGYQPFTADELRALLWSPLLTKVTWNGRVRPGKHDTKTALMWLPLVALFTGLREAEICQLRAGDIQEEDGIPFEEKMAALTTELRDQMQEAAQLDAEIKAQLAKVGFEL